MIINTYGDETLPKIILLHPMLADGKSMLKLTEGMEGRYCFIAPDLSGQGSDKGDFVNAKQEAETQREGYGHCMYPAVHYEEYGRLLERYMKNKAKG